MGYYRLRGAEDPERLFAVGYVQMTPKAFPPPRATPAYTSNLPPQLTTFFGREEELSRLEELLIEEERRLVTLTGPGDSGKTRLALEAAGHLSENFRGAGSLARRSGDPETSRALLEESITIARELKDKAGEAECLLELGGIAHMRNEYEEAAALFRESLAIYRELADKWGIAESLIRLAYIVEIHGDSEAAESMWEEALAISRELGNKMAIAQCLNRLGNRARLRGDLPKARALTEEGLALGRELGWKHFIVGDLLDLAVQANDEGCWEEGRRLCEEYLPVYRQLGMRSWVGYGLGSLARAVFHLGDYARARACHEEKIAIFRELGVKGEIAGSLMWFGHIADAEGDHARASDLYGEALVIHRELTLRLKPRTGWCLSGLAVTSAALGEPERTARLFGAAEALREALGVRWGYGHRERYGRAVALARAALGEEAFAAAWAAGRAMTLDEAVAYALEEDAD